MQKKKKKKEIDSTYSKIIDEDIFIPNKDK